MPDLIETYARSTGFKIDKPFLKEDFFPVPFDRYITLSAGSGQGVKNYDLYQMVIDLLNPILSKHNIVIVLLGRKEDPLLGGTHDLREKTTIAQSHFVLKNALLHFGNDSWTAHMAGLIGTPLVALYGTTDKVIHGPHWQDKTKTILLESHRCGKRPSFGAEQGAKTVNLIRPEEVAEAILTLLKLEHAPFAHTEFIGTNFLQTMIEVIPNVVPDPNLLPEMPFIVRMDYEHNEAGLQAILQRGRKVHLFTAAPINPGLLAHFKGQIVSYNHEVNDQCPIEYLRTVVKLFSSRSFFSRETDLDVLARLRFQFFGVEGCRIEHLTHRTRKMFVEESALYLNQAIPLDIDAKLATLRFKTNKYLLSRDKIYLSFAHYKAGVSTPAIGVGDGSIIDCDEFWRETNHQMIYTP